MSNRLTCRRALGNVGNVDGGLLSEDRLGSGSLLWFGGFGFEELLLFKHLLLLPLLIFLLYQLSPHLLLFFTQAILLRLPSKRNQTFSKPFLKRLQPASRGDHGAPSFISFELRFCLQLLSTQSRLLRFLLLFQQKGRLLFSQIPLCLPVVLQQDKEPHSVFILS